MSKKERNIETGIMIFSILLYLYRIYKGIKTIKNWYFTEES